MNEVQNAPNPELGSTLISWTTTALPTIFSLAERPRCRDSEYFPVMMMISVCRGDRPLLLAPVRQCPTLALIEEGLS